jgi:hypothetical protein
VLIIRTASWFFFHPQLLETGGQITRAPLLGLIKDIEHPLSRSCQTFAQSTVQFSSWQVETGNTSLNERPTLSTTSRTVTDAHGSRVAAPSNFDSVFQNTVLFSRRENNYLGFPRPENIGQHPDSLPS